MASLALQCLPGNTLMQAACEAAGECEALELPLLVQPSTAPHGIVLVLDDTPLQAMVKRLRHKASQLGLVSVRRWIYDDTVDSIMLQHIGLFVFAPIVLASRVMKHDTQLLCVGLHVFAGNAQPC